MGFGPAPQPVAVLTVLAALSLIAAGCLRPPTLDPPALEPAGPHDGPAWSSDAGTADQRTAVDCARHALALMTWNVLWLGDPLRGPRDDDSQLAAVQRTLHDLPMDLVALQEVASIERFEELLEALPRYDAVRTAHAWPQQMALLFRRERFALQESSQLEAIESAGRPPLVALLTDSFTREPLHVIVVHAKANADHDAWAQRRALSDALAAYLRARPPGERTIVLGDFNDELRGSIVDGLGTPYASLLELLEAPTAELEAHASTASTVWGSVVDHVTLSPALAGMGAGWHAEVRRDVVGSQPVAGELSVSDHFPVTVRTEDWGEGCERERTTTALSSRLLGAHFAFTEQVLMPSSEYSGQ